MGSHRAEIALMLTVKTCNMAQERLHGIIIFLQNGNDVFDLLGFFNTQQLRGEYDRGIKADWNGFVRNIVKNEQIGVDISEDVREGDDVLEKQTVWQSAGKKSSELVIGEIYSFNPFRSFLSEGVVRFTRAVLPLIDEFL